MGRPHQITRFESRGRPEIAFATQTARKLPFVAKMGSFNYTESAKTQMANFGSLF